MKTLTAMMQTMFKPTGQNTEVRANARAMRVARKLAALHNLNVERVRDNGGWAWWVTHATLELDESYCVDGTDVLASVKSYIDAGA